MKSSVKSVKNEKELKKNDEEMDVHLSMLRTAMNAHRQGRVGLLGEEAPAPLKATEREQRPACASGRYLHTLNSHCPPALELPSEEATADELGIRYSPGQNDDYSSADAARQATESDEDESDEDESADEDESDEDESDEDDEPGRKSEDGNIGWRTSSMTSSIDDDADDAWRSIVLHGALSSPGLPELAC